VKVAETDRLALRWLREDDAGFIRSLVNEPSWIRFIGARNVRSVDDARRYLRDGPIAMYARTGFGLYLVEHKATGAPIGICGLIKRDTLEDVDLGFAFLPASWGQGFAAEAAAAVIAYGRAAFGLSRIVAIVSQENVRSERLLGKLGFRFERCVELRPGHEPLKLYGCDVEATAVDVG
jgi:RimJ/RimL family protein N-acetyltransferase